jgi:DNA-binding LytR/AlgR family response regulator
VYAAVRGLHLVTLPLTPLRFAGVAGALVLLATGYCLAHGLVIDDELNLPRTLAWAVTSTLPWVCAWEALKRLSAQPAQTLRLLLSAAVLIAALAASAAMELVLGAIYSADSTSFVQVMYSLLPVPVGIALARLLVQPSRPKPAEVEHVLAVPTRGGLIEVRATDIEYVKAAGNYVELVVGERTLLLRATLTEVGEQLRTAGFVRVHRSLLVNCMHVMTLRRGSRGRQFVKLRSGVELPVGRQFVENAAAFVPIAHRSSRKP